jgi:hypothetical protein
VSNPPYGSGPDPRVSAPDDTPYADPYQTGQATSSTIYEDLPAQPADVSYGSVEQPPTADMSQEQSKADVAKDEAAAVKDTAVEAGKGVAETAKDEAANVAAEAKYQAKSLLNTASDEVRSQASTQQSRLAEAVHSLSKELGGMASNSPESGPLTDLAHQAARKGGEIAHWLENREPADVLEEVRAFARRRPVMFLGLCALAGIVAGRLTRSAVAANTSLDSKTDDSQLTARRGYAGAPDGYAGTAQPAGGDYSTGVPQSGYPTGTAYPGAGEYPGAVPQTNYPTGGGEYSAAGQVGQVPTGGYQGGVPQAAYQTGGADYTGAAQPPVGGYQGGVPQTGYPTGGDAGSVAAPADPAEGEYPEQQGRETEAAPTPPSTGAAGGMPSSGSGYADEEGRQQPYGGESNR